MSSQFLDGLIFAAVVSGLVFIGYEIYVYRTKDKKDSSNHPDNADQSVPANKTNSNPDAKTTAPVANANTNSTDA